MDLDDLDDDEDERDYWQEFKDDVAMGIRDRAGNWLEPNLEPEPDDDRDDPDSLLDYEPPPEPAEDPWGVAPAEYATREAST